MPSRFSGPAGDLVVPVERRLPARGEVGEFLVRADAGRCAWPAVGHGPAVGDRPAVGDGTAVGRRVSRGDGAQPEQAALLGRAVGQFVEQRLGHVHVALPADRGGHDGDGRRDGGESEREMQAAGERLLDQVGEERPASDVGRLLGGQLLEGPRGAE